MDGALVTHLSGKLVGALLPSLLPFVVACGAGNLLLRLLDDLRCAATTRARRPLAVTALFTAVALWTVPLLPLLAHWPLGEETSAPLMTIASFCWSLAVAALWCVLGGNAGAVRAVVLGALLSLSGPVTVLLAGAAYFDAEGWHDVGLLGMVIVLTAVVCAAALRFAMSARSGATGVAVRHPAVSLFVSMLFGAGLTFDAVYAAAFTGRPGAASAGAPAWLQLLLMVGSVATVLAGFLLGYRDRAAGDAAATVATREIRLRKETMQALNDLEQSYRRREAELAARHQLLLDGADVGLWEFDLVTRSAQFSERFAGMLGYALKDIGPSTSEYLRLVHPDDLPRVLNRIQAHVDDTAPAYAVEFRMRHKDGTYRHIAAHGRVQRAAGGRAVRMAGSHIELAGMSMLAEAGVPETAADAAAEGPPREALWASWSPLDHAADTAATIAAAPASGTALPSINPNALR